jgi:hypothetical protein
MASRSESEPGPSNSSANEDDLLSRIDEDDLQEDYYLVFNIPRDV